jgi:hypothetical protein
MSANLEQGKPALVIISSELVHVEVVQVWENEVQVRKADGSMSWRSIHNVAPLDPRLSLETSEHDQPHEGDAGAIARHAVAEESAHKVLVA